MQIAVALALAIAGCNDRDVYLGSDVHPRQPASGSGGHGGGTGGGASGSSGNSGHGGTTSDAGTGLGIGTGGRNGGTGGAAVQPLPDSGTGGTQDAGMPSGCPTGFDDCDGRADNRCEANLDSDENHCGDCDTTCPRFGIMSFGSTCTAGVCVLDCEQPFANCDGNPDNGCENFGACP